MFADPSLFSLYPAFTAVLAVSAAAILAVVCSVLYTMVCAVTERAGRASGKCYMISHIAELAWLLALAAQLIITRGGGTFYPVI